MLIDPRLADLLESDTEPEAAAFFLAPKLVAMGPSKSFLAYPLLRAGPAMDPRSVSEALLSERAERASGRPLFWGWRSSPA